MNRYRCIQFNYSNMKCSSYLIITSFIVSLTARTGSCWQFFTSIQDITLSNSRPEPVHVHSDYYYGDCKRVNHIFYTHVHLDHLHVLAKNIVRGWIEVRRIPTCIIIRATSFDSHLFRSTAFNFQICVPRVAYCHSHHRYKYHYYEWYIPPDMVGGMNWDIYFYGPESLEWQ